MVGKYAQPDFLASSSLQRPMIFISLSPGLTHYSHAQISDSGIQHVLCESLGERNAPHSPTLLAPLRLPILITMRFSPEVKPSGSEHWSSACLSAPGAGMLCLPPQDSMKWTA